MVAINLQYANWEVYEKERLLGFFQNKSTKRLHKTKIEPISLSDKE